MRLTCVQLVGFKSFVEPTTLHFPGSRTAIVGPNGCGKSNVIDAVRWVMGESSAKQLRGDGMTDVIFNGSGNRRAQAAASVELQFDNTQSRLSGQFAAFNTLAIKRRLTRDGDNQFFINGEKCRRKDITDLFAGTGLGPRSYAIIEQGTIARLIDAKPEDLRGFIEEAAGITKYKERRRETSLRIEHSRENLARLNDIAAEVQAQLDKLGDQARAAELYRTLKQRIRNLHSQQKALHWQQLQTSLEQQHTKLEQLGLQHQAMQVQIHAHQQQQEALAEAQSVARDAQEQATALVMQLNQQLAEYLTQTAQMRAQLELWRQQEQELGVEIAEVNKALADVAASHAQHAIDAAQLQQQLDVHLGRQGEIDRAAQELNQHQIELQQQLDAVLQQQRSMQTQWVLLSSAQASLQEQIAAAASQVAEREAALSQLAAHPPLQQNSGELQLQGQLAALSQELDVLDTHLLVAENTLLQCRSQLDYQRGCLGRTRSAADPWPSLPGPWSDTWAAAQAWLQPWISARPWAGSWAQVDDSLPLPALLIKPDANSDSIQNWLSSWQPIADRQAALIALENTPDAILVTPAGEVFARDWMYRPAPGESRFNLEQHLQNLSELAVQVQLCTDQVAKLRVSRQALLLRRSQLAEEILRIDLQDQYRRDTRLRNEEEYQAALAAKQQLIRSLQSIHDDINHLALAQVTLEEQTAGLQRQQEEMAAQKHNYTQQSQEIVVCIGSVRDQLAQISHAHSASLPLQARLSQQLAKLTAKRCQLQDEINSLVDQDEPSKVIHAQLDAARKQLASYKQQYSEAEKQQKILTSQEKSARQHLELLRAEQEGCKLALQALTTEQQGLTAEAFDITSALAMLPAQMDADELQTQMLADKTALEALGPVNLAALDEFEQASMRAAYLAEQQTDLHQALECLENAIKQIDRDTRGRFKQTFDAANEGLQALFPQVFGGGSAYIELVGDDLLTAGVAIMARPPGKKNSTIHLLSGGEKALTALALVFALFRLNPAPFCLLDEVDAPLDDANVARFARLVEAMAQQVQFIFITHNKIAMEMAEHLLGVTMQEPGVSRVVSVDIAQAADLAAD